MKILGTWFIFPGEELNVTYAKNKIIVKHPSGTVTYKLNPDKRYTIRFNKEGKAELQEY